MSFDLFLWNSISAWTTTTTTTAIKRRRLLSSSPPALQGSDSITLRFLPRDRGSHSRKYNLETIHERRYLPSLATFTFVSTDSDALNVHFKSSSAVTITPVAASHTHCQCPLPPPPQSTVYCLLYCTCVKRSKVENRPNDNKNLNLQQEKLDGWTSSSSLFSVSFSPRAPLWSQ